MGDLPYALVVAVRLDVLILGGGLQGLLLLDEFASSGRSCVLVADADLGSGQTLHSHGLLNTGFGFAGPELRIKRDDLVLPFLSARGIRPYGEWFLFSPDEVQVGENAPAGSLPEGLDPGAPHVRRMPELNFPRRRLIESLANDHLPRVVHGRVVEMRGAGATDTVMVQSVASGDMLLFAPAVVIAATGTGTNRFLTSIPDASHLREQINFRRVHILCVKGPRGILPEVSVLSLAHRLNVVAHPVGNEVVWYSTPFQDDDPTFDDAPDDAEADVDPAVVEDGFRRLEKMYPALAKRSELRFTAYAGYRQDVGDVVGTPMCELVGTSSNLVVALPSLAVNAWSNARIAVDIVDAVAPRKLPQPDIPGSGVGVRVGLARDERPEVEWKPWRQAIAAADRHGR